MAYQNINEANEALKPTLESLEPVAEKAGEAIDVIKAVGDLYSVVIGTEKEPGLATGVYDGKNHPMGLMRLDKIYEAAKNALNSLKEKIGKSYKFEFDGVRAELNRDNFVRPLNYILSRVGDSLMHFIKGYKDQFLASREATIKEYDSFLSKYGLI